MAGPPAVLPSIFSLCDLAALDDSWMEPGALEGTLNSSVSYLGLDSMFAADLDPLSGAAAAATAALLEQHLPRGCPAFQAGTRP